MIHLCIALLVLVIQFPVTGQDMDIADEWTGISEPEIMLESPEEIFRQIIADSEQNPEKIAGEINKKILMNPAIKYHLLSAKEKRLWEDILFTN